MSWTLPETPLCCWVFVGQRHIINALTPGGLALIRKSFVIPSIVLNLNLVPRVHALPFLTPIKFTRTAKMET
jgi:hypothetical protein